MEPQCLNCKQTALVKCFCKEPEQMFCLDCLGNHVTIPGVRHITKEITRRTNSQCSCKQAMEVICLCQDSKTRLCHNCLLPHMASNPALHHSIEPAVADSLTEDAEDLKKFISKKKIIDALIKETRLNLSTLNKHKQDILKSKDSIVEALEDTIKKALDNVKVLEDKIESVISLLESRKFASSPNNDWVDEIINKCRLSETEIVSKEMKYIISNVNKDIVLNSIKNFIDIVILKEPMAERPNIYYIKPKLKEIVSTDPVNLQLNKIPFPAGLQLKDQGSWCEISSGRIFYCGGHENPNGTKDAFIIDLIDSDFISVNKMIDSRVFHALVRHNSQIFVFGGYQGKISIKNCEKFDLVKNTWTSIGEMNNPRSGFTVSLLQDKIYIAGDSKSIEVFDVLTGIFELIEPKLEFSENYSITVYSKNKLLILQKDKLFEANTSNSEVKALKGLPSGDWWSPFTPVAYQNKFYFARQTENSLFQLDADSFDVRKLVKF